MDQPIQGITVTAGVYGISIYAANKGHLIALHFFLIVLLLTCIVIMVRIILTCYRNRKRLRGINKRRRKNGGESA